MLMTCLSYAGKPEGRSERRTDMKPMKEIYLAGGCFWGTEHFLKQIEGVEATQVGYANGNIANPTYQQVCTGTTDFAETVKVQYDPDEVDLTTSSSSPLDTTVNVNAPLPEKSASFGASTSAALV